MGAEVIVPLVIAGISAGASAYNTQRTARRQDQELARGIRTQSAKQRQADALVGEQVKKLEGSRSDDERRKSLASFTEQLARNKKQSEGGLMTPQGVGSQAFQQGQQQARQDVGAYGGQQAGLMARMEAPTYQRMGEGFDRGYLATDINRIGSESRGEDYLTELRTRAIRRNPWIDAAAQIGMSYGMAGAPGFPGMGGPSAATVGSGGMNAATLPPPIQGNPVGNWKPRIWTGP